MFTKTASVERIRVECEVMNFAPVSARSVHSWIEMLYLEKLIEHTL